MEEITEQDVKALIEAIVAGANEHIAEAVEALGEEVFRNSLALILVDTATQYGFVVRAKRFRVIEEEELKDLNPTATIETTKDFFVEFLNSEDWNLKAIEGYNTYQVNVISSDGRDYIHYRNLMGILRWLYDLISGG